MTTATDPDSFISENTKLLHPPLVPEITLHLAEESMPIWEKTEEELGAINVPPPFWAFAWAGGQALARYVLDHREQISAKRVLDLGSGSGLCAIAAKLSGASHTVAADIDVFAERAIALNAAVNQVEVTVMREDLLNGPAANFDIVLIGDLFYDEVLSERVMAWAHTAQGSGAAVLVGDPRRNYFPVDRFDHIAEYSVPVTRALEDSEIKKTAVWRLN